ncbi:MAG: DUF5686 and carboxypeptidase regulatory-like domain-containing protein [Cytophagales bacterium]|nr:DUF5686 and carboxypeptidase regulatory-like domain-containing protein [Cytophagales bacterium]
MPLLRNYLAICILFISSLGFSQNQSIIRGKVTDENGVGLPFATLLLQNTSIGTTTNLQGEFEFSIPVGSHQMIVQFVGYERQIIPINDGNTTSLNIAMEPVILQLNAVTVSAKDKDPAYRVIRETIKKRKYHRDLVQAFGCDVYIKGLQRLDDRPDKILGVTITVDTGIVYLSESVSQFQFERPNKIKEVMISSKVSGNNNAFSWNQASDMLLNFYENGFSPEGLSERPIVSPIANNAFFFYDYKLEGFYQEGDRFVNKIKVIPRRATDPVYSGYLYIVEDQWNIHSVDLLVTKERGVEFLDSIRVHQVYAAMDHDIWMPVSQDFTFQFKVFGFKGSGHFVGVYSNYVVEPNYDVYQPKTATHTSQEKVDLFKKGHFTREVMKVEEEANDRDSLYWIKVRPIPLSKIEQEDYIVKDSVRLVKESRPYKDSVDRKSNTIKPGNLLTGYTYRNSFKGNYYTSSPLLNVINFNSVEGWVLDFTVNYRKILDRRTIWSIQPTVRYGFGNEQWYGKLETLYYVDDRKFTRWGVSGGHYIEQLNANNPIDFWSNSYFTITERRNFMKIFSKSFLHLNWRQEVKNGLLLNVSTEFQRRNPMENNVTKAFGESDENAYSSNHPENIEVANTQFDTHNATFLNASLRWRPGQRYINRPDRKVILGSKYPDLTLSIRAAVPVTHNAADFQQISFKVSDNLFLGYFGSLNYSTTIGTFLSKNRLEFLDFHHFNGNRIYTGQFGVTNFQTLDYYLFSTQDQYFEAHAEHHFNEFLLNNIPLIKKLNWQTVASVHTLNTPSAGNFTEWGIGIEHIFKFLRIDYYQGYHRGKLFSKGVRIGAGF